MPYEVEVSDEFRDWYEPLSEAEQNSIERVVLMLIEAGPAPWIPLQQRHSGFEIRPSARNANPA
jgi:hypothetical protein